ncbi:hypothetical protein PROFUN_10794 [Planoprotostelium fungivorum]|uniref:Uncharacterized protein n=1 Tax=Planoprotostelium fungivorum TaxID=1890364 RepID=A0A2P6NCZ9_9EUKA|nr:hypothetical protein PROFUN_10794 [Planoprotostelium fungivorum]
MTEGKECKHDHKQNNSEEFSEAKRNREHEIEGTAYLCFIVLPSEEEGEEDRELSPESNVDYYIQGHFVDGSKRNIGLMGTQTDKDRKPDCCYSKDDPPIWLNLTLCNFQTNKEVTIKVEKTGGDFARLSASTLSFETTQLIPDAERETTLTKFFPKVKKMSYVDLFIVMGKMTLSGDTSETLLTEEVKRSKVDNIEANSSKMTFESIIPLRVQISWHRSNKLLTTSHHKNPVEDVVHLIVKSLAKAEVKLWIEPCLCIRRRRDHPFKSFLAPFQPICSHRSFMPLKEEESHHISLTEFASKIVSREEVTWPADEPYPDHKRAKDPVTQLLGESNTIPLRQDDKVEVADKNIYDALKGKSDPAAVYSSNHYEHTSQVDPKQMAFNRDLQGKNPSVSVPLKSYTDSSFAADDAFYSDAAIMDRTQQHASLNITLLSFTPAQDPSSFLEQANLETCLGIDKVADSP